MNSQIASIPANVMSIDRFRSGKAYTIAQAARLAGSTAATVRRWLRGYEAPGHQMAPVFGERGAVTPDGTPLSVSFLQLAEIVVVARFRRSRPDRRPIKLEVIRDAYRFALNTWRHPYPFASLDLREFGGHILHVFNQEHPDAPALALDMAGQWVLPGVVREELEQFEFGQDRLASKWYPAGREVPIVVDPRIGGGRPTIVGTGVTVDILRRRFAVGESIREIAEDFDLEDAHVEEALRYTAA